MGQAIVIHGDIARRPHSLSCPLHADYRVLDQSDQALVCRARQKSGSVTTKLPGPSNGPNQPTKAWLRCSASATKRSRHYATLDSRESLGAIARWVTLK